MKELIEIQAKLKAPKSRKNSFGNYNYRSCEDILEAVKPLLAEQGCTMTISDDIVEVGERIYVKATATISKGEESQTVTAFARESLSKKGMDDSQITGTASSYARKYALNGLFLIDDNKDADTDEFTLQQDPPLVDPNKPVTKREVETLKKMAEAYGQNISDICRTYKVNRLEDMTHDMYGKALMVFKSMEKKHEKR